MEIGIILGQYISHGAVTLRTNGNQATRYKNMPRLATKHTIAKLKVNLTSHIKKNNTNQTDLPIDLIRMNYSWQVGQPKHSHCSYNPKNSMQFRSYSIHSFSSQFFRLFLLRIVYRNTPISCSHFLESNYVSQHSIQAVNIRQLSEFEPIFKFYKNIIVCDI